jgi:hypothetical protein
MRANTAVASDSGKRSPGFKGGKQENPVDLLQDLEDKIILKFRKKIIQLEKKFTDDMMQKSLTAIGADKADLNKSVQIMPNQLTSILSSMPLYFL